jgi:hypothetical protein
VRVTANSLPLADKHQNYRIIIKNNLLD